jgi:hypothetical protein
MWQILGELASIRVTKGFIKQISSLNIKEPGCYIYIIIGWIMLYILWKTNSIPGKLLFFAMTFLGIWSFELYMENYSYLVPLDKMALAANVFLVISVFASILVLIVSYRSKSELKQLVLGGVIYLLLSIVIMSSGQWRKPQDYYLKYEKANIKHKIYHLDKELNYIKNVLLVKQSK